MKDVRSNASVQSVSPLLVTSRLKRLLMMHLPLREDKCLGQPDALVFKHKLRWRQPLLPTLQCRLGRR